jgi:hypothetical protein
MSVQSLDSSAWTSTDGNVVAVKGKASTQRVPTHVPKHVVFKPTMGVGARFKDSANHKQPGPGAYNPFTTFDKKVISTRPAPAGTPLKSKTSALVTVEEAVEKGELAVSVAQRHNCNVEVVNVLVLATVTTACARRTGAAASVEHRRREFAKAISLE